MDEQNIQVQKSAKKFDLHKVFATIGVILIVMIIIVGGIWYFVQNAENKVPLVDTTPIKIDSSSTKPKSASVSALDKTMDWQTYKNTVVGFTIKYPPKWVSETIGTDPNCTGDQAFFAPTNALLGKCASGFGGLVGIFRTEVGLDINKQAATYTNANYNNLVKNNTTVAGKNAIKITGISQISNAALDQKGYTVIIYLVDLGNNRALILSYAQAPNTTDNTQNFENMVSTLTFN